MTSFFYPTRRPIDSTMVVDHGYYDISPDKKVFDEKRKKVVGYKRTLAYYYGKPPNGTRSDWVLKELRVNSASIVVAEDNHSLCEKSVTFHTNLGDIKCKIACDEVLKAAEESKYFKDIPVVIVSFENEPARINSCLEEGAEEFFLKPVQLSDVNKLRRHLLKGRAKESDETRNLNNKKKVVDDLEVA